MQTVVSEANSGPPVGPDTVWVAVLAVTPADDLALRALLTDHERAQLTTIQSTELKRRMIASMLLNRALLAHVTGGDPGDWAVLADARGAPTAWLNGKRQALQTSRSRSEGMVAAAVSARIRIGVDIEALGAHGADSSLARQFFSLSEIEALEVSDLSAREDLFFRIWTLKEAYIKARGLGFLLPLDSFALIPTADGIRFQPPADDVGGNWQFHSTGPSTQHRLAIACENPASDIRQGTASLDPSSGEIRFQFSA